jgi:hypothetical protein
MLADPSFAYQQIGDAFGVTRQRIFALAKELGVDGKQRRHDPAFRVRPHVIRRFKKYPPAIQAVMDKLRRAGLHVAPYNVPQPSRPKCLTTSLKMILVKGEIKTQECPTNQGLIDASMRLDEITAGARPFCIGHR